MIKLEQVKQYEEYVVKLRRDIHMNPEPGFKEFETTKLITNELKSLGFEVIENINTTGVIGVLKATPGKTVALRADIDALYMQEENEVIYKSKNDGLMHSCGHDTHVAMLLGACKYFSENIDKLNGTLKVIFQPAEEGPLPGGAVGIVEKGYLDDVDAIFGIHITTAYDSGIVAIKKGAAMAAPDEFTINVEGKGTHGSAPETGWDPVLTSAQIITALQSIVSRNIDTNKQAVISVTTIHGGTAFNIIPDKVTMTGTIRTFDEKIRNYIYKRMEEIIKGITTMNHCTYQYNVAQGYPPLFNDDKMVDMVSEVIIKSLGKENLLIETEPSMGGEDFAYYLQKVPGAFYWLGANPHTDGTIYNNHNPKFDVDESTLIKGSLLHINSVLSYLK